MPPSLLWQLPDEYATAPLHDVVGDARIVVTIADGFTLNVAARTPGKDKRLNGAHAMLDGR